MRVRVRVRVGVGVGIGAGVGNLDAEAALAHLARCRIERTLHRLEACAVLEQGTQPRLSLLRLSLLRLSLLRLSRLHGRGGARGVRAACGVGDGWRGVARVGGPAARRGALLLLAPLGGGSLLLLLLLLRRRRRRLLREQLLHRCVGARLRKPLVLAQQPRHLDGVITSSSLPSVCLSLCLSRALGGTAPPPERGAPPRATRPEPPAQSHPSRATRPEPPAQSQPRQPHGACIMLGHACGGELWRRHERHPQHARRHPLRARGRCRGVGCGALCPAQSALHRRRHLGCRGLPRAERQVCPCLDQLERGQRDGGVLVLRQPLHRPAELGAAQVLQVGQGGLGGLQRRKDLPHDQPVDSLVEQRGHEHGLHRTIQPVVQPSADGRAELDGLTDGGGHDLGGAAELLVARREDGEAEHEDLAGVRVRPPRRCADERINPKDGPLWKLPRQPAP